MAYPVFMVPAGDVLPIFFDSYDGGTGASITLTGLAAADIEIYKDGSATQRSSDAGYTLLDTDGIDFDGITGIHGFSIDTGDNTDAGFYTVGAWFTVVVSSVTIDGQTVSFVAAQFRLMAAESVAGKPKVDVDAFGGTAGTFASGIPETKVASIAANAITATSIAADAITNAKIADDAIAVENIKDAAITAAKIASDAITDAKVASDVTIASVTGAVGSVTGAVGSVTGNVGGNVTGSVGSVATGGIAAASFAAGAIDAAAIAANAIGASELASDAVAEIADQVWDEIASGHVTAGSFGQALNIVRANTAQAGASTTITLDASASAVDDFYNNTIIFITGGTGAGQSRIISDYVGSTKVATVSAWATNPSSDSVFVILPFGAIPGASAPTAGEIADAVLDEALSGHTTPGSLAQAIADIESDATSILADTNELQTDDYPTTLATLATAAALATVDGIVDDILVDTADMQPKIGTPAGASVSADIAAVKTQTAAIETDTQDIQSRIGTPSNLGGGASLAANLADIEAQTDDIGTAGAGLSNIPWNASWDAEVQSEAADALVAYDPPTKAEMDAGFASGDDAVIAAIAALNNLTSGQVGDAVLDEVVEGSYTLRQMIRVMAATLAGEVSGAGTTTVVIRDMSDTKTRVTATVDADGNRSALTLDAT